MATNGRLMRSARLRATAAASCFSSRALERCDGAAAAESAIGAADASSSRSGSAEGAALQSWTSSSSISSSGSEALWSACATGGRGWEESRGTEESREADELQCRGDPCSSQSRSIASAGRGARGTCCGDGDRGATLLRLGPTTSSSTYFSPSLLQSSSAALECFGVSPEREGLRLCE